jgi:hypothetical protein
MTRNIAIKTKSNQRQEEIDGFIQAGILLMPYETAACV